MFELELAIIEGWAYLLKTKKSRINVPLFIGILVSGSHSHVIGDYSIV